jgi:hypothetical protein
MLITGIDGILTPFGRRRWGIIHDADECHEEIIVQLIGGHMVRVPATLGEVLPWFA